MKPLTVADLLHDLGDVPTSRVLTHPPVGTATELDVVRLVENKAALVELVNGTLVTKDLGNF